MSKRISKKVREEAALLCAVAASLNSTALYRPLAHSLGISKKARALALKAWWAALPGYQGQPMSNLADAEAECLLRTGWEPS